jgi:hypothetical protein
MRCDAWAGRLECRSSFKPHAEQNALNFSATDGAEIIDGMPDAGRVLWIAFMLIATGNFTIASADSCSETQHCADQR